MRQYGRREFLKTSGLVLAAASTGLLTACGSDSAGGGGNVTPSPSSSQPADSSPSSREPDSGSSSDNPSSTPNTPDDNTPSDLEWVVRRVEAGGQIVACNSAVTGRVVIPSHWNNMTIASIGGDFNDSRYKGFQPTELVMPDTMISVGYGSLKDFSSLQKISFSPNLRSISSCAFKACTSLTELYLPDSLFSIDGHAFSYCSSLRKVALSKSLWKIEIETFSDCNNLKAIYIPKSLQNISQDAFKRTDSSVLEYIYYEGSQTEWDALNSNFRISGGNDAFKNASHLIPNASLEEFKNLKV